MFQPFTTYPAKALANSNQIKGMTITIKLFPYIQNFGLFTLKIIDAINLRWSILNQTYGSKEFYNIHKKKPELESLFTKAV